MKKNKSVQTICVTVLILAGFTGLIAMADTVIENNPAKLATGTNPNIGKYYALARMTNGGSFWIKPDTNIVVASGTLMDISGYPPPYASYVVVAPFGSLTNMWASNSVTFSATNSLTYELTAYVTSPAPPPTNNQMMVLKVTWSTNSP